MRHFFTHLMAWGVTISLFVYSARGAYGQPLASLQVQSQKAFMARALEPALVAGRFQRSLQPAAAIASIALVVFLAHHSVAASVGSLAVLLGAINYSPDASDKSEFLSQIWSGVLRSVRPADLLAAVLARHSPAGKISLFRQLVWFADEPQASELIFQILAGRSDAEREVARSLQSASRDDLTGKVDFALQETLARLDWARLESLGFAADQAPANSPLKIISGMIQEPVVRVIERELSQKPVGDATRYAALTGLYERAKGGFELDSPFSKAYDILIRIQRLNSTTVESSLHPATKKIPTTTSLMELEQWSKDALDPFQKLLRSPDAVAQLQAITWFLRIGGAIEEYLLLLKFLKPDEAPQINDWPTVARDLPAYRAEKARLVTAQRGMVTWEPVVSIETKNKINQIVGDITLLWEGLAAWPAYLMRPDEFKRFDALKLTTPEKILHYLDQTGIELMNDLLFERTWRKDEKGALIHATMELHRIRLKAQALTEAA